MAVSGLSRRVATGAVLGYAAQIGGRLSVFVGLAVLARLLTPHEFGLFGMALAAVSLFEVTRDLGLRSAVIYFGQDEETEPVFDTAFILAAGVGVLLTLLLLALAPVAGLFYGRADVTNILAALSVYYLISGIGTVPDGILRQRLEFGRRFWTELGAPIGRYTVAIVLALQGHGAWSLVWGQLAGITLEVILAVALCRWRPRFQFRLSTARKLLNYGWQTGAVNVLAAVILSVDYLMIGRYLGSTELGLYTLAFKLPDTTIVALATVASNVLLPTYVQFGADRERLRDGLLHALRYLALALAPAAAGIGVLAPTLVPLLFGDQWAGTVPVVRLLAIWAFFHGILFVIGPAFLAAGRPRLLAGAEIVWGAVLIPAVYAAAQVSIVAVAAVHIGAILVYATVKLAMIGRLLAVDWWALARTVVPSLAATGLMVGALLGTLPLLAGLPLAMVATVGIGLGAAVYLVGVILFDAATLRDGRALARAMLARS